MRKILSVLLISIFMLSSYAAPYTYDDLISIMNVSNIELLMDDEVIKSATYDLNEAKGSYSPTIDLTLSGTYMVNPPSISRESLDSIMDQVLNKENPFASNIEGMFNDFDKLQIIDKPFMYMAQLNLTQPIFTWGKVTNAVKLYEKLLEIRKSGVGILLISEELDEIMDLSDRIAVIYKGSIQRVLDKAEATRENLGILMAGVKL